MIKINSTRGFSLVEMLVYVFVVTILTVALVSGLVSMIRSFAEVRVERNLNETAMIALGRMVFEIRQASSVDAANSIFDANPGQLSLNTTDQSGAPTTVRFSMPGGVPSISVGGGAVSALVTGHSQVSSLIFRRITTAHSQAVKIELTLGATNFYATAVLRGSY